MTSPERPIIRSLQPQDIKELQTLDAAAHGEAWSQRTFVDEVEQPNRVHLVAEFDGELVGHASAWINDRGCHITNVAVANSAVGQGYASRLLLAVIRQVLDDHRIMNLQLEVRPSNRRAQRLYSRFGFVPVGIDRDFYDRSDPSGNRDAVVMAVTDVCSEDWRTRLDHIDNDKNDEGAAA